jgi:hypothetical protein
MLIPISFLNKLDLVRTIRAPIANKRKANIYG